MELDGGGVLISDEHPQSHNGQVWELFTSSLGCVSSLFPPRHPIVSLERAPEVQQHSLSLPYTKRCVVMTWYFVVIVQQLHRTSHHPTLKASGCLLRQPLTNTPLRVSQAASVLSAETNWWARKIRLQVKQAALFQASVQYITSSCWLLVLTRTHCLRSCLSAWTKAHDCTTGSLCLEMRDASVLVWRVTFNEFCAS